MISKVGTKGNPVFEPASEERLNSDIYTGYLAAYICRHFPYDPDNRYHPMLTHGFKLPDNLTSDCVITALRSYDSHWQNHKIAKGIKPKFAVGRSEWLWCGECQRAFKNGTQVEKPIHNNGLKYLACPYDGCKGSSMDFVSWSLVFASRRGHYPRTPVEGIVYEAFTEHRNAR